MPSSRALKYMKENWWNFTEKREDAQLWSTQYHCFNKCRAGRQKARSTVCWLDPTNLSVTFHLTVEYTFSSSKRLIRATKSETHRDKVRRIQLCSLVPVSVSQDHWLQEKAHTSENLFLLTVYYTKRDRLKSVKVKGMEERVQERTGSNVELSSPFQSPASSPQFSLVTALTRHRCERTQITVTEHSPEMHALVPIWFPTNVHLIGKGKSSVMWN